MSLVHPCTTGNGDSGTTGHYLPIACEHLILDVKPAVSPIKVTCPDGSIMISSKVGILNLPNMPLQARTCHLFDSINGALLSIGQFCDHGMVAHFDESKLEILDKHTGALILTGQRDNRGMYMLPLVQPTNLPSLHANSSVFTQLSSSRSCARRVSFISSAFGNPADSTLLKAAKAGFLKSIPNVTVDQIRKYSPDSIKSAAGHLDQARQNTWSTKKHRQVKHSASNLLRTACTSGTASLLVVKTELSSELHGDLTGRYPVTSRKGNNKVLIGYSESGRFIKSVPMKGDTSDDLIQAYDALINFFRTKGKIIHSVINLDNQTSNDLEYYFEHEAKLGYHYAPPGNHRTLHAERDIRTWKNHFIATRAGADPSFPKDLWDEVLDQVDLTLNLLRSSGVNGLSSWDYTCGPYDYTRNPIGPAGAKVLVYENPESRKTFDDHGVEGFYLGPSWDHYRCFRVYIPSLRSFRTSDTLSWHLHDPFGLLSNHSTHESITGAIEVLTIALDKCNATSTIVVDTAPLHQCITALKSIQQHSADNPAPPGFHASIPRVVVPSASHPAPHAPSPTAPTPSFPTAPAPLLTDGVHSTTQLPRVATTIVPPATPVQSVKPSRNLRTNKHHVRTDPSPTVHNASKILSHKGSDRSTKYPLRFRVRWQDCTSSQDTYEPWSHVKDCTAAITYVQDIPSLWYLLEHDLFSNETFNARDKEQIPWYRLRAKKTKVALPNSPPPPVEKTLTRARAAAIAQAVMSVQQFALYDLLGMPPTQAMQTGLANLATALNDDNELLYANAAGDMDDNGNELKYKSCITGPDKDHWIKASVVEFHRLLNKFNTIRMIKFTDIPSAKKPFISYYNPQCKTKMKADGKQYRVRGTYGGNRTSSYNGITASYQAAMTTVKLLLNKNISIADSRWMTMDVADMYLHSRLPDDQWEYMVLNIDEIPQEIIDTYNIMDYTLPGDTKVYVEVVGALYGMKQAGYLANKDIVEHLANNGYTQQPNTPCLFTHVTDDIEFSLITDDFGVRYGNKAAADRLLSVMSRKYTMTHDWSGAKYAGFDILNDYSPSTRRCELSMQGYMVAVLKRFKITATHNVLSPEFFQPINYGSKDSLLTKAADTSPPLTAAEINLVQQIVGCLLYYARGVDATMRPGIDHVSMEQTHGTQRTMDKALRLLAYGATFPNATIVYYPSDMILKSNVDGSYNSESDGRSRAAVFSYCGRSADPSFVNGPIECISTVIPTVVASAAETEYASLFVGGKSLLPLRYTLLDMNCIQPPTEIITDNVAAKGIATNTCKQRRSKSIDMRYHWIRDRVGLKDFVITWRPGSESIADYLTKTQPVATVLRMRKFFVKECLPTFRTSRATSDFFSSG